MGLFFDKDLEVAIQGEEPETQVMSICNPYSPGKQWNKYLFNDNYTALFELAGYQFVNNYFVDMSQGIGCNAMTGASCQTCRAASGGNWEACYCTLDYAIGLHCPMSSPVYYVNQRILYQLGGVDWMLGMPGSRVKCDKGDEELKCDGMCQPKCLCDFDHCSSQYNCTKDEVTGHCSCENQDGIFYESQCAGYSTTPMPTTQPTEATKSSKSSKSSKTPKRDKKKKKKTNDETNVFD